MVKTASIFFFLLLFISCGKSGGGGSSSSQDVSTEAITEAMSTEEVSTNSPVPYAAQNFVVKVNLSNFNAQQEDKVLEAADLIEKVVASEEFKNEVLNHTYNGKKTYVDNDGLSNAEIYKKIIEGSEKLRPGKDSVMNLDLEIFTRSDNTIGYTMPDVIRVWMNSKFLNIFTPDKVTTNMMHEWLHKLGFKHAYERTNNRSKSVPYAVGYLVSKLAAKMRDT